jgi:hypothetical protein
MGRAVSGALARVTAVVSAGRRVADAADPIGREARARLPGVTGLSPASVELALREHLETEPSAADLAELLGRAGEAARCHVVLSANVCTAALRAIALACAAAPDVLVKPSRRDPVVAELLVRAMVEEGALAAAGGSIALVGSIAPGGGDEVHVYGSDETVEAIRAALPPGVTLRPHGSGFGVAVIEAGVDLAETAAALARDVVAFDQRGCLSPRVALVSGGEERGRELQERLASSLAGWQRRAPLGALDAATAGELRRYADTAAALGSCLAGEGFIVGLDEAPSALLLPPPARAVHVMPAAPASLGEVASWLAPWASKIAALGAAGSGPLLDAVRAIAPRARLSAIGLMQRPPLDGPVDLRGETPG